VGHMFLNAASGGELDPKRLKKEASSRQTPLDFHRYIYGGVHTHGRKRMLAKVGGHIAGSKRCRLIVPFPPTHWSYVKRGG
jgi:hypothetical protein